MFGGWVKKNTNLHTNFDVRKINPGGIRGVLIFQPKKTTEKAPEIST